VTLRNGFLAQNNDSQAKEQGKSHGAADKNAREAEASDHAQATHRVEALTGGQGTHSRLGRGGT